MPVVNSYHTRRALYVRQRRSSAGGRRQQQTFLANVGDTHTTELPPLLRKMEDSPRSVSALKAAVSRVDSAERRTVSKTATTESGTLASSLTRRVPRGSKASTYCFLW